MQLLQIVLIWFQLLLRALNAATVRGISTVGTTAFVSTITNNLIANINTNNDAPGAQTTTLAGIVVGTGTTTITGNTIRNLTSASQTTATGINPVVLGIGYTSSAAPALISNNTIHTLKATNSSTATAILATGIYFSGPTQAFIRLKEIVFTVFQLHHQPILRELLPVLT